MSWIINKKSKFTKIFSQALLEMKANGKLEKFQARKSQQNKQSFILPDPKQKSLGFKKLALLFIVLVSGIFISILVVLFEFIAKIYSVKQKSTTTIKEETEKVFQRILKRKINISNSQDLIQGRSRIPIPVKKTEIHGHYMVTSDDTF